MTHENDDEAALPRHWLATTDTNISEADRSSPRGVLAPGGTEGGAATPPIGHLPACWPFDPHPPAKTPAENGYRYCNDCDSVVEAKGHECEGRFGPKMRRVWVRVPTDLCPRCRRVDLQLGTDGDFYSADCMCDDPDERAEFAESLLCALALRHGFERMGAYDLDPNDVEAAKAKNDGWVWTACDPLDACPYCDAAREVRP